MRFIFCKKKNFNYAFMIGHFFYLLPFSKNIFSFRVSFISLLFIKCMRIYIYVQSSFCLGKFGGAGNSNWIKASQELTGWQPLARTIIRFPIGSYRK